MRRRPARAPVGHISSSGRLQWRGRAAGASWPGASAAGSVLLRKALYRVAAAVSSKATPSVPVMRRCTAGSAGPTRCSTYKVVSAAGMLPADRLPTMRQSTRRARASRRVPPALVKAANNRSVPTARYGLTPKKKIRMGVISEPPPTPVRPTTRPTKKPARMNATSCMDATVGAGPKIPNYIFLLPICAEGIWRGAVQASGLSQSVVSVASSSSRHAGASTCRQTSMRGISGSQPAWG